MYTMAILIITKLYQSRHPDLNATAYAAFTVLGVAVFLGTENENILIFANF